MDTEIRVPMAEYRQPYDVMGVVDEDRLATREGVEDATDYRLIVQGGRMAINACFLAAQRDTTLSPLPKQVRNHRMANNRQVRRAAYQEFQELRFRDLIVRPQPHYESVAGDGRQAKQRRSGRWRNVAYGPKFSQHRWTWINEYETRPGDTWLGQPPTTIVR
jgi:hypothetical protein